MVLTDPRYDIPRDLEGYGEEGFDPQWPNGAKIAISFVLNYEEGAERTPVNGDDQSEPYLWEKGASSVFRHGHRYINAESEYEYGSRSGAWRILRLFKEFGWNYTTYAVAQAMEKNPSFAKACVREGHEIAAHGYRWLDLWDMTLDEDRENIRKALVSLKESTGEWPVGMYFGRGTPNTKGLFPEIWEEMVEKKTPGAMPMLYCSEAYNDDVPYWQDLPAEKDLPDDQKKGMLIVPYNYDCNDGKFHMSPGFVGSTMYLDYLKSTFDMLYREGRSGSAKMMNIPMHSRILGKPGRSEALRTFMLYVNSHPHVWVTTRKEIALHFKSKFPYKPGHLAPGRPERISYIHEQLEGCGNEYVETIIPGTPEKMHYVQTRIDKIREETS